MSLDVDAAHRSLARLGERMGVDAETAARGVLRYLAAQMSHALRLVTLRRGHDPRDFTFVAFGGAGPLHAALLARELGVSRDGDPARPGPLLGVRDAARRPPCGCRPNARRGSRPGNDPSRCSTNSRPRPRGELEQEAGERRAERFARLRYVGQEHTLEVPLGDGPIDGELLAALRADFDAASEETYAFRLTTPIELVEARVSLSAERDEPVEWSGRTHAGARAPAAGRRPRPARRRPASERGGTQVAGQWRSARRPLHRRGAGDHRARAAGTVRDGGRAREPRDRGGNVSDRFTMDVLREAFFAVTDEMFVSLKRTSQSPADLRGPRLRRRAHRRARRARLAGQRHRGVPRATRRGRARHARPGAGSRAR